MHCLKAIPSLIAVVAGLASMNPFRRVLSSIYRIIRTACSEQKYNVVVVNRTWVMFLKMDHRQQVFAIASMGLSLILRKLRKPRRNMMWGRKVYKVYRVD